MTYDDKDFQADIKQILKENKKCNIFLCRRNWLNENESVFTDDPPYKNDNRQIHTGTFKSIFNCSLFEQPVVVIPWNRSSDSADSLMLIIRVCNFSLTTGIRASEHQGIKWAFQRLRMWAMILVLNTLIRWCSDAGSKVKAQRKEFLTKSKSLWTKNCG